ncbi:MAG: hypothetical protein ACKVQQ_01575, partial [Burkholderiales bacterium]
MAGNKLRVAVVGYGWWGRTIVRTLAGSGSIEVAAVVEPDPGAAANARADAAGAWRVLSDFA